MGTEYLPGGMFIIIAPAGCGKSTVANGVALCRLKAGLRGHIVYSYNATGKALLAPFAETLAMGGLTHGTFHQFARLVSTRCHVADSVPIFSSEIDMETRLAQITKEIDLSRRLHLLQGVVKGAGYRACVPSIKIGSTYAHLGDLANGIQPPEFLTWAGMALRWRCHGGKSLGAWKQYADTVLEPLGLWGNRDAIDTSLPHLPKHKRDYPQLLSAYDFVRGWRALTMVRCRLYDPFLNTYRLELAWYPERFDLSRGSGICDFLIVDEAQDVPGCESVYLPRALTAWGTEAWFAGDPNQELYTFMGTVNMLRTLQKITTTFVLSINFRVPGPVWAVAETHVRDLPPATVVKEAGVVEYCPRRPAMEHLQGAVVMFRGNRSLVSFAAQYMSDQKQPARVSRHCFARIAGAWRLWRSHPGLTATKTRRVSSAGDEDEEEEEGGDTDDFSAFELAFQAATGKLLAVLTAAPDTWLIQDDDTMDAADADPEGPPLLTTVHGFKGQGHHDVVLMPGIIPHSSKPSIDTPQGRLAYTAITRACHRLRIVMAGSKK